MANRFDTPNNYTFFFETERHYHRTAGGSWSKTPFEVEEPRALDSVHYVYSCGDDTARFFNRIGSCRRSFGHYKQGYLCDRFSIVSPDGREKAVSTYVPFSITMDACGNREHEMIRNIDYCEYQKDGSHNILIIHSVIDGEERFCSYDIDEQRFVS